MYLIIASNWLTLNKKKCKKQNTINHRITSKTNFFIKNCSLFNVCKLLWVTKVSSFTEALILSFLESSSLKNTFNCNLQFHWFYLDSNDNPRILPFHLAQSLMYNNV